MLCPTCGATVEGSFCSRCGTPLPPAPPSTPYAAPGQTPPAGYVPQPVPPVHPAYHHHFYMPRVSSHVQTLSILWLVYAGYLFLTGLIAALFLFGISAKGVLAGIIPNSSNFPFAPMASFMGIIAVMLLCATVVGAVLAVIAGVALLNRRPWGRIFALITAVLALIKFPAGTALGIYTLWVLAPGASGPEYEAISRHN
jgi:hypothetical protein